MLTFCVPEQAMPRKPNPQSGRQNALISLTHLEHHLHIRQILFQEGKAFTRCFETPVHPQGRESPACLVGTDCPGQSAGACQHPT